MKLKSKSVAYRIAQVMLVAWIVTLTGTCVLIVDAGMTSAATIVWR